MNEGTLREDRGDGGGATSQARAGGTETIGGSIMGGDTSSRNDVALGGMSNMGGAGGSSGASGGALSTPGGSGAIGGIGASASGFGGTQPQSYGTSSAGQSTVGILAAGGTSPLGWSAIAGSFSPSGGSNATGGTSVVTGATATTGGAAESSSATNTGGVEPIGTTGSGALVTGGTTCANTSTTIGAPGTCCAKDSVRGCSTNASAHKVVCVNGTWTTNGDCEPGQFCDTRAGETAGSCLSVVAECGGKNPGDKVCSEQTVETCGPDLVTATAVQVCGDLTPVCQGGVCLCTPKTTRCDAAGSNGVQTCDSNGTWGGPMACTNQTCVNGSCQGVCEPNQRQCDPAGSNGVQTCDASGSWGPSEGCPVTTPLCRTGICIACPGTGGPTMVGLPLNYCIDSTEVTQSQYQDWLNTYPSPSDQISVCSWNASFTPACTSSTVNSPVVCVDWCDAYAYCAGVGKRLCGKIGGGSNGYMDDADTSKSQWYAACSSNGTYNYPYSNTYQGSYCNGSDYWQNTISAEKALPVSNLNACQSPVVGYAGVFDLSGNIMEWEDSCKTSNGQSDYCHLRGGSFSDNSFSLACPNSDPYNRNLANTYIGFRCCSP